MLDLAIAIDTRETRTMLIDCTRPFAALKPVGHLRPVIGRYATLEAAKRAAKRWNKLYAPR